MASGFIEISGKKSFSTRWTAFDETVRIIVKELEHMSSDEESLSLIVLLKSRIPPIDLNDQFEMGWGFIDEEKDDVVARIIEFNGLTETQIGMFWKAALSGYNKLKDRGEEYSVLLPDIMHELIELK